MPFSQGQYCYKPNLQASCCPQYTIKFYDIPLLLWIVVDSRVKIRCGRVQAFQKPETNSQSVGHLLILSYHLRYILNVLHLFRWNRFILYDGQNEAMEVDNEKCFTSSTVSTRSLYYVTDYFIPSSGLLTCQIQRQVRNRRNLLPFLR